MATKNALTTTDQSSRHVPQIFVEPDPGYEYEGAGSSESQKQQIRRFLSLLRRYWWLILGTVAVITSLVVVYEAQKPDFYIANAKVQVNNETNPAIGSGPSGSIVLNQGTDPTYFATQLRILEGSGLLRRVVESVDLEHNEAFRNPPNSKANTWQNILRMVGLEDPHPSFGEQTTAQKPNNLELLPENEADFEHRAERLAPYVETIKRGLIIAPVKDTRTAAKETRMIDVTYQHSDPTIAAKVANAIADIYVLQNLERKVEANATASEFLEKRVAELQNSIRSREERLANYSRNNQIISLDSGQNTVVQRLADLNLKLGLAENDRISAEAAYLAAKENPMAGIVAHTADPRTAGLETQLTALNQQLAQLKTEYTDEWPEVKRVKRQIAQIENELQDNKKRAQDAQGSILEQKYHEALAKERELRSAFAAQRNAVLAQNEAAINYRIYQQEIDSNRTLLASVLAKSRETDVVLNGTPNNVLVADRATIPRSPSGPERTKTIMIAFIASLFAGVGLAFVANWLNDSIQVGDELEDRVGLPVVGRVPALHGGRMKQLVSSTLRLNGSQVSRGGLPVNFESPLVAESFNEVRASLLLSTENGAPKTILVTSADAHEGKTITSFNLAKCLAQLGDKVLLVDADLRCPQMHNINSVKNEIGLTSLLTAEGPTQESIDGAITENISPNLDLLPAGPAVTDPATLLSLGRFQEMLTHLGALYKFIVIDSPPALYFADSMMIAAAADSVLVVGRINFSSSELLRLSKKKLESVNANVVGIVLNDVPLSYFGHGKYDYYRNGAVSVHTNGNGSSKLLDI